MQIKIQALVKLSRSTPLLGVLALDHLVRQFGVTGFERAGALVDPGLELLIQRFEFLTDSHQLGDIGNQDQRARHRAILVARAMTMTFQRIHRLTTGAAQPEVEAVRRSTLAPVIKILLGRRAILSEDKIDDIAPDDRPSGQPSRLARWALAEIVIPARSISQMPSLAVSISCR